MERQLDLLSRKTLNRNSVVLRLAVSAFALTAFCIIAYKVSLGNTETFDRKVSEIVYSFRNSFTKSIFVPWTYLGNAVIVISAIGIATVIPKTRWSIGVPTALTGTVTFALYKFLKYSFARPRPEEVFHLIQQGGFSFPSGHSMNGLFCYGMIIFLIRRNCSDKTTANCLTAIGSIMIIGIGFSRIFVGVHYPTDVAGGFLLGLACLMPATLGIDKVHYNLRK